MMTTVIGMVGPDRGRVARCCTEARIVILFLCWFAGGAPVIGQNLVPNPSFEDISTCPLNLTDWTADYWGPVAGSSDNFHSCASPIWEGVPMNFQGFQYAHTGNAYAGLYTYVWNSGQYREYIQAPLTETLQADHCYEVGCWINLADNTCGIDRFGILLTPDAATGLLGASPQVDWVQAYMNDTISWIYISGSVLATGNEAYISIGNFEPDVRTHVDPDCWESVDLSYYYVDDVIVQEIASQQIDIELGAPVVACDSFVIDPGQPEYSYVWSTGDVGPTLTVYSSGTYSVTASGYCTMDEDEIDVTILGLVSVDLGDPAVDLCLGDTYEIELDPAEETYTWNDGSTGPSFTITTEGTYSVTLDNGCHAASDEIMVHFIDGPLPFSLGPDTILCVGDEIHFNFDPSLGSFTWQDGSTGPAYTIGGEGTFALTISNACGEQSDMIQVTSLGPPAVYLGPDTTFMCIGSTIDIQLDDDGTDYVWQDGTTGPEYTILDPGIYSVTASNACGTSDASMIVVSFPEPWVELGPPVLQVCGEDSVVLVVSGNTGTYTWQDGSTDPFYLVTTSGIYSLTVSNPCGADFDEIEVTFGDSIEAPDLGPDINLCPGDQAVLSVNGSGGNVLWSDMSTAETLLVTAAGTYSVQVSNDCFSYTDTIVVTVSNAPPALDLPLDFALCQGDTVILDAMVNGVTYLWSDGSSGPQLEVTAPGQYALTISSACGMDADTILVLAGEPLPVVELGPDTAICPGETLVIVPTSANVTGWSWLDGSTQSTFTTGTPALVTVIGSNSCGMVTDTMEVALLPATPPFSLGSDTAVCPGETVALSIGLTGIDILWHDGSTGAVNTVSGPGIYYATVSTVCGSTSDTILVDLLPAAPVLDLGADQAVCPGESVVIDPGMGNSVAYLWQDGSTGMTYTATQDGWIVLTVTNECGMSTDSLLLVETTDGPQLDLGPDRQACIGETITIDAGIGGVNYEWQDGSTGSSLTVTATGTYSLTVSNACGTDSDTIAVDISGVAPVLDLGQDTVLCQGDVLTLSLSPGAGTTITWQDNSNGTSYAVTTSGLYSVQVTNRCGTAADSILIDYLDRPVPFSLGPDTVLCPGQSVVLQAPVTSDAILWQDGSSNAVFVADQPGIYTLHLTNACGSTMDTMEVFVQSDEPIVDLGPDRTWCSPETFLLDATQAFPAIYTWSTGAMTPVVTVTQPGTYSVEVKTPCYSAGDEVTVIEADCDEEAGIYIPNVFSPNGDGINDEFRVEVGSDVEVLSMEGAIYDRWGDLVFSAAMNPFTWDGRMGETRMNPAVYVYVIRVRWLRSGTEELSTFAGSVTLMR